MAGKRKKKSAFLQSKNGTTPPVNQKGAQAVYNSGKKGLGGKNYNLPRKTF